MRATASPDFHSVRFEELTQVIANELEPLTQATEIVRQTARMPRFLLSKRIRDIFIKEDIRLFESEGNYVRVYFQGNRPLILRSLNYLDERLDPRSFFRASRKHIINLKWIESVENWFNGGLMVKLKGGEQVEISRRQAARP